MSATVQDALPPRASRTKIVLWCLAMAAVVFYCPGSRIAYYSWRFHPSRIVGLTAKQVLDSRGHPDSVYLSGPTPPEQNQPSRRDLEARIIAGGDGDFVYHGWWWQTLIVRFEKGIAVRSFDAGK